MTATMPTGERAPIERTEHPHIVKSLDTLGGEPRVEGTRLAVRQLFEMVDGGMAVSEIVSEYPGLTEAQVHDALSYAYDHPDEIAAHQERHDIRTIMRDGDLVLVGNALVPRERLESLAVSPETPIYTWETLPRELEL